MEFIDISKRLEVYYKEVHDYLSISFNRLAFKAEKVIIIHLVNSYEHFHSEKTCKRVFKSPFYSRSNLNCFQNKCIKPM